MKIGITSIGIANPPYKQSQMKTAEFMATILDLNPAEKRILKSIYKATGIDIRHSVINDFCKPIGEFEFFPNDPALPFPNTAHRMRLYQENALPLTLSAIKNCFEQRQRFDPKTITHLITVSCTGLYAPGLDIEITQTLGLHTQIKRTCINFMGCYGAFNGLKVADAFCRADPHAKVLVVCVELCTLHFQKNKSLESIVSNAIFADGAAAVLVEANPDTQKYFSLESFYCDLLPQSQREMTWQVGNDGFDIRLSSYVPDVIEKGIAAFTEKLFQHSKLTVSDIHYFAIHPGGLKILQACEKSLAISSEQNKFAYEVLRNYGNMSSPTILFVLKAIWDAQHERDKNIFACAFGPGLTLESMLIKT